VATDLGEASQAALRLAVAVASAFAGDLLIVHVLPAPPDRCREIQGLAMTSGDLLERRLAQAEAGLRRARAIAGDGHAHAAIRCGATAAEIVRVASETDADLIVALAEKLHCPVHALDPWRGHRRALRGRLSRDVAARACATLAVGPHCRRLGSRRLEPQPGAAAAAG
jgi:nucleotide-binding universal stress UspA family protein